MSIAFKVDLKGLDKLQERIAGIRKRAADSGPVLRNAAKALRQDVIEKSFDTATSPLGETWAPIKPSTLKRRKKNKSPTPLVDTGQMRKGVFAYSDKTKVRFGVQGAGAKRKAPYHLFGQGSMRRRFLPWDDMGKPSFVSGRAADWYARVKLAVVRYVLHGKRSF